MKRLICLLLVLITPLLLFAACKEEPTDTDAPVTAEPSLIVLPDNVNYISIYPISPTEVGSAIFDKNNYGALLQLVDELQATSVLPLAATDTREFNFEDCFDLNIYGEDGTLLQISVDKTGLISVGFSFYELDEGFLTYERIREYYDAFRVE